jgi:hypothetical protein
LISPNCTSVKRRIGERFPERMALGKGVRRRANFVAFLAA